MRRVGKSTILKQIQDTVSLLAYRKNKSSIINFELLEYESITHYKALYAFIQEKMTNEDRYYIFLDEVQVGGRV